MEPTTHTIIAVGSLFGAYYLGRILASRSLFDQIAARMLDKLEQDGYIAVKKDKDGEKNLIPISEIIAKATRDAFNTK
jgi:DNA-binding MarR family transcriptional regulator